jgi:AcrR family transcriptional regulator
MAAPRARRAPRKRPDRYHHGDLRRALLQEAVRTIQAHGVDSLTLRAVGERLGVSRTALYRHFADKSALLAAVAQEGFRTLRLALLDAWNSAPGTAAGLDAMGEAYVRFAVQHPSHYRVMFGGFVAGEEHADEDEGGRAFQALVDALVALQLQGLVRDDDPLALAHFVWSAVHGLSMLIIDGQLQHQGIDAAAMVRFATDRLRTGIAPDGVTRPSIA